MTINWRQEQKQKRQSIYQTVQANRLKRHQHFLKWNTDMSSPASNDFRPRRHDYNTEYISRVWCWDRPSLGAWLFQPRSSSTPPGHTRGAHQSEGEKPSDNARKPRAFFRGAKERRGSWTYRVRGRRTSAPRTNVERSGAAGFSTATATATATTALGNARLRPSGSAAIPRAMCTRGSGWRRGTKDEEW